MRLRSKRSLSTLLLSSALGLSTLAATPAQAADPVGWDTVKITELRSTPGADFVELQNTGSTSVDITGWTFVDNDASHTARAFTTATSIAPGAYLSFETENLPGGGGFGLGASDFAKIATADGTQVDLQSWTTHRTPSWSLCYGEFVTVQTATPGAANACPTPDGLPSDIELSEVRSNPNPDIVELHNTGTKPVDISGWKVADSDHAPVSFVSSKVLGKGQYFSFDPDSLTGGFGLGASDSVTIFTADGTQVDTYAWTTHRTPSFIRCGGAWTVSSAATPGQANDCPTTPAWQSVKVNEVESNGDTVADWVELKNNGTSAVDISGWKILDNDPDHVPTPVVVPQGTSIAAGGYYAIYTEVGQSPGFGLGADDSVTVYLPDGTTKVDEYAWTAHAATTYGRCPDGTGDFTTTTVSTRGTANACSPIRLNEINTIDPDWVELVNVGDAAVDVSGWTIKDNDDTHVFTIPNGTSIAGKGHATFEDLGFGLGGADSARLFNGSTLIDSYSWTTAAATSFGRCKDGIGDFTTTKAPTKGAANSCPGLDTVPWDGSQSIRTADVANTWNADLSGLVFDPKNPDVLWGAQNKRGTLWKLTRDGQNWVPADGWTTGKDPKYTDGTGAPDTEGITVGPDGFLYAAAERNNNASGVSRMSVLRYDPSSTASSLTATHEWNLTAAINAAAGRTDTPIGANLGFEGVTFVPDAFLTAGGFRDQTKNKVYDPADYPGHGSGLFVVAVEDTGHLYAFALSQEGSASNLVADIASGLPKLADVTFDPERKRLWAVADDTVDGQTSLLKLADGAFVPAEAYDRPAGLPNLNNEGFALAARTQCVDGSKEVLWSDDGNTGGHSLRTGTIHCTAPTAQTVTFTSTPPTHPVVGQTYRAVATGGGSANPVTLSASGACTVLAGQVVLTETGACTVKAEQAAADGYTAGSATQSFTVGKASTTTALSIKPTQLVATVSVVAPGGGSPGGSVTFSVDGTSVGTVDVGSGGTATLPQVVAAGASRVVKAEYSGGASYEASTDQSTRTDPEITATVSGTRAVSGWYRTPVTVTFTCTPGSGALAADCPSPVTVSGSGADQSVTRSVSGTDGGQASATASFDIDRVAPTVKISGVAKDQLYVKNKPAPKCVASDALSGVASCTLTSKVTSTKTTLTAKATDRAGNTSTTSVSYTTLAFTIGGATYPGEKFTVRRGRSYSVVATVPSTTGSVYGPYRVAAPRKTGTLTAGRAVVHVPTSAKPGQIWKVKVVSGGKSHVLQLRVIR